LLLNNKNLIYHLEENLQLLLNHDTFYIDQNHYDTKIYQSQIYNTNLLQHTVVKI